MQSLKPPKPRGPLICLASLRPKPRTLSSPPPPRNSSNMSRTHTTSTTGPIWAELASLTLQAFTPDLINRLQSFIARTPSFDTTTHIPLLATLVIRHITLSLKESPLPVSRSFRDVAYHAVMSNKIITKRERSIVRAVSVGRLEQKEEPVLKDLNCVREKPTGKSQIFPRAGGKDCLQSASMRRLLMANQLPLEISSLQSQQKQDNKKADRGDATKRERKRASIRFVPPRNNENREPKNRQSPVCEDTSVATEVDRGDATKRERKRASIRYVPPRNNENRESKIHQSPVCEDTSVATEDNTGSPRVVERHGDTLRGPFVKRERPSKLVQLRRQRLERRKAPVR